MLSQGQKQQETAITSGKQSEEMETNKNKKLEGVAPWS